MPDKKRLTIIIPVIAAVLVICSLAVSGHITKKTDEKSPTAKTSVSLVNEEETEPTEVVNAKVTLLAVGDNLIHNTLISAGEQSDGSLNYDCLYENIKPEIEKADIAVIDQETILGGSDFDYTGYPVFNSPWEIGDAAIKAGFDVFLCATNHTLDKGWAGIENEIKFFSDKKDVVQLGVNANEDRKITYYEKNGITFSMLNYTYGTNGIPLPEDKPWCVDLLDKELVTKDIKEARANSDVVIVFPHWGTEYSFEISDYQKEYTQLFLDLGVDIVIGGHPHVIEPVKWVKDKETGRKMLVYYSLGNFISHQLDPENLLGGMAKITIKKSGEKIEISSAKFVPIVTHYRRNGETGKFDFNVYKLNDYTDELGKSHSQDNVTKNNLMRIVNDVVDEEFISME
jgi:poly-gamma-glutamate synthesis protein (capsule biosynthesis protein)